MLPPECFCLARLTGPLDCGRIHAGLADRGKGIQAEILGLLEWYEMTP
jgi:hypothetical protein